MASLSWSYENDVGCLDFGAKGQTVGKICFPGTPKWMSAKLFNICQNQAGIWHLIPARLAEIIKIEVFENDLWTVLEDLARAIEDGFLIRVRMDDKIIKLVFVEGLCCVEASSYGEFWESPVWTSENPVVSPPESRLMISPPESSLTDSPLESSLKKKAEWIAGFVKSHGTSGMLALLLGALVEFGPAILKALPPIMEAIPSLIQRPSQKAVVQSENSL